MRGMVTDVKDDDGARLILHARSAVLSLVSELVADLGVDLSQSREGAYSRHARQAWADALGTLSRVPEAPVSSLMLLAHLEAGVAFEHVTQVSPTDLLARATGTDYEQRWRQIFVDSILARESWSGLAPDLSDDAQWTVAANAASLAAAITSLDRTLLPSLDEPLTDTRARVEVAASFSSAHLRLAALEVLDVALAGPLPSLDTSAWLARRGPVAVQSPYSLIEAQARLPQLLQDSGPLPPADIVAVATAQALAHQFAAKTLRDPARANAAAAIAKQLTAVSPLTTRQLRTLPNNPATDAENVVRGQALEMTRFLLSAQRRPPVGAERMSQAMVALAPAVLRATSVAAIRELHQGRWLITYGPQPNLFAQRYPQRDLQTSTSAVEWPNIIGELRRAEQLAGPAHGRTLPPPSALDAIPQPFAVLHDLARERLTARPARVTDIDAEHATASTPILGEEHRARLNSLHDRLRATRIELDQRPVRGIIWNNRPVDSPQPQSGPQI